MEKRQKKEKSYFHQNVCDSKKLRFIKGREPSGLLSKLELRRP